MIQGCSIHESSENLVDLEKDAFLLAARNGRLDALKVLLEYDCDASKRTLTNRSTALHLISYDPEIKPKPVIESSVILLLDHGVPLEARNAPGNTPLLSSACNGKISIAEFLLDNGADIHSTDNDGHTALHCAAWNGHYEIGALLISKGANIQAADNYGNTALHHAAGKGHYEVVALLISKGACLETRIKVNPYTPLHCSCLADNGSGESAKVLLQAGADKEATLGYSLYGPLHLAAQSGNLGVVNELLAFGVEIDAASISDWRALHCAKNGGHWRIIEALLAKGADPMLETNRGSRPSQVDFNTDAKIPQGDRQKCLKLLEDAEDVWFKQRRKEKEKRRQARKDQGMGPISRFIAGLND